MNSKKDLAKGKKKRKKREVINEDADLHIRDLDLDECEEKLKGDHFSLKVVKVLKALKQKNP